jgi:CheY-like chemotaxis protein
METKRILVVDNEQYIQEVIQVCLETVASWEVLLASSGQECLNQAAIKQPDAILLDVMMPDMDGITTFQKLQNNPATQHIPVILLTATLQSSDHHRYAQLGLTAAIAKPFDPLKLSEQVASALGWTLEQ